MTRCLNRPAVCTGPPLDLPPHLPETLGESLRAAAREVPTAGIMHIDRQGCATLQSYPQLLSEARRVLGGLQAHGLDAGSKVVLQIADAPRFLAGFWGAILGGIVPVPLAMPADSPAADRKVTAVYNQLSRASRSASRTLCRCWDGSRAVHIITDQPLEPYAERGQAVLTIDELLAHPTDGTIHRAAPEETAFLQFSSGSTGDPKGVVLTHRNVVSNLFAICELFYPNVFARPRELWVSGEAATIAARPTCSWLPYSHDMGLIGFHLAPIAGGAPQISLPPRLFFYNPALFLRVIHEHRVAYTASPNFGLLWMIRRTTDRDLAGIDLSCVRAFLNGAEPISARTLSLFLGKFAAYGFDPRAMCPVYGMAEASLLVTASPLFGGASCHRVARAAAGEEQRVEYVDRGREDARDLVDVGHPAVGVQLRVVDDADRVVTEDVEGHIQIAGPNVTSGYNGNPTATAAAFSEGWLRTGDLGFVRNGRLVITGRYKDVICVHGQKFSSHDIEEAVRDALRVSHLDLAVCGVPSEELDRECVVLFAWTRRNSDELGDMLAALNRKLSSRLGLRLDAIVAVDNIPRTTSGKIQRYQLRERFLAGAFPERSIWAPQAPAIGARAPTTLGKTATAVAGREETMNG